MVLRPVHVACAGSLFLGFLKVEDAMTLGEKTCQWWCVRCAGGGRGCPWLHQSLADTRGCLHTLPGGEPARGRGQEVLGRAGGSECTPPAAEQESRGAVPASKFTTEGRAGDTSTWVLL